MSRDRTEYNASRRRDRAENPEKHRAQGAASRARLKARRREQQRANRAANPDKHRRKSWTYNGYPEPTRPRPEVCELCCGAPKERDSLNLDHDHRTGRFRGWLCRKCNMALGLLRDSSDLCVAAARYLRASELAS